MWISVIKGFPTFFAARRQTQLLSESAITALRTLNRKFARTSSHDKFSDIKLSHQYQYHTLNAIHRNIKFNRCLGNRHFISKQQH